MIALGVRYATIVFSFSVILSVNLTFEKMNQAIGNMKITMISLLIGCVLNIILDPMIIFGHRTISGTWNCRSCTGNRIRTVCTDCDLYSCISEKTKAGGLPSGIFAFDQGSDEAALQYRCAGYFEYGVDLCIDHQR